MTIRRVAKISGWLTGAFALALVSFATVQAQDAAPQAAFTYTVLHSFPMRSGSDGKEPATAVTPVGDGSYYGTTLIGGDTGLCGGNGCGTVFKLAPDGTETVLYAFQGGNDGANPHGAVILDEQGNLYGTTEGNGGFGGGGSNNGSVYKLTPDGIETVLHTFPIGGAQGWGPVGRLMLDDQGNLYGTTFGGGDLNCSGSGCGVVFKLVPDGTYTVLHIFTGIDGASPNGDLIRDRAGNLYGTTAQDGLDCPGQNVGCGTVFKLSPHGTFTTLYAFTGGSDGGVPEAGLVGDINGNLYGTTKYGGGAACNDGGGNGCGTVFKLAPDGTETVLYAFLGGSDGAFPMAALYRDPQSGALYGTTAEGGPLPCKRNNAGCGTVFVIKPDGNKQIVHSFGARLNGDDPVAALVKGQGRELIGTTQDGNFNYGVVYSLKFGGQ